MDQETKIKVERAIAWTGPLFIVTYFLFWGVYGHYIPPPNFVGMSAQELVTNHYLKYQGDIEIGMTACCFVGLLYLPWSCLLASMLRDENGHMNVLGYMELTGGALTAWVLAFCPAIWLACATQAGLVDATIIKAIHSFTWYIYDMTYAITNTQLTGLGLYVVLNKKQKIFPAWTGWAAIAVAVIFLPLLLIAFVPSGPFAVGGVWNFYVVFGTWLFGFFAPFSYYMLKELSSRQQKLVAVPAHAR